MSEEQFIKQRSLPLALALARNLGTIAKRGEALHLGSLPHDPSTASVCIGGGPSCGGFGRIRGGLVLTVNTAAGRVCRDLAPDILCVREVVSTADQIAALGKLPHRPRYAALDIQVHPDIPAALERIGVKVLWFVPAQLHIYWLARLLRAPAIYGGESALTACAAIATRLGCGATSLIGTDFAFGRDGSMYGDGTAWAGVRIHDSKGGFVDLGDRGGMREHAARSKVPGPPLREQADEVVMEGGGLGLALATWTSQRLWMEQWSRRNPERRYANLSGGARVEGWQAATETIPGGKPEVPTLKIDATIAAAIVREVHRQIRLARDTAESDSPATIGDAGSGLTLVETAAAADYLAANRRQLPDRVRFDEIRAAMRKAADRVERAFAA